METSSENITEAVSYILEIPKFTKKNQQEATADFLRRLGNPGLEQKIVHVAGTNGKGSVCAFLNSIYQEGGYKVGMFTSPHLEKMQERFQINGTMVSDLEFYQAYLRVREEIRKKQEEDKSTYHPTFFEFLFFMGMLIFDKEKTDLIILETGMGGRLDATNVVQRPSVCTITKIGLDHTEYLGDTLEKIAAEKAGIIKNKVPLVYHDFHPAVTAVMEMTAKAHRSPVYPVGAADYHITKIGKKSIDFSMDTRYYGYISLTVATCAIYQVQNAALAVRTAEILSKAGCPLTLEHIQTGVKNMFWKGRMEEIMPGIILDGAHNEDGIEAFLESVSARPASGNRYLMFSVVADKDYSIMIRKIADSGLFHEIIVTKVDNSRALSLDILRQQFMGYQNVQLTCMEDVKSAFVYSQSLKTEEDQLYIAGSLYLVGQIEGLCRQ